MTFAPMNQTLAVIAAFQAHGIELPSVPTRFRVEAHDTVYVDIDLSGESNIFRDQFRGSLPFDFEHIVRVTPDEVPRTVERYRGMFELLSTTVVVVLHHNREQYIGLVVA